MHRFRHTAILTISFLLVSCSGRSTIEPCGVIPDPLESPKPVFMAVASEPVQAFAKFEFTILTSGEVSDVIFVSSGTKPFNSRIERDFSEAAMEALGKRKYPMADINCNAEETIWLGRPFDDA